MQIEFKEHQYIYLGLRKQIEILERRCVEHQNTIAHLRAEVSEVHGLREADAQRCNDFANAQEAVHQKDLNAYEARCGILGCKIADLESTIRECKTNKKSAKKKVTKGSTASSAR